jgi:hypothetical protein
MPGRQLHDQVSSRATVHLVFCFSLSDLLSVHSLCNGSGYEDSTICAPCRSSCPPHKYLLGACLGTSKSDTSYCVDCAVKGCPAGQYLRSWCDGTTRSDAATCTNCSVTSCPRGMYVDKACTGDGKSDAATCKQCEVHTCPPGYYLPECDGTGTEQPTCLPCTVGSCPQVTTKPRAAVIHQIFSISFLPVSCFFLLQFCSEAHVSCL